MFGGTDTCYQTGTWACSPIIRVVSELMVGTYSEDETDVSLFVFQSLRSTSTHLAMQTSIIDLCQATSLSSGRDLPIAAEVTLLTHQLSQNANPLFL